MKKLESKWFQYPKDLCKWADENNIEIVSITNGNRTSQYSYILFYYSKESKDLTQEEINSLDWTFGKFALVNRQTRSIFIESNNPGDLQEALNRMTPKHPLYRKLQLVERQ